VIDSFDIWPLVAGLVGAFGNQLLYWGNRLRRRSEELNLRMVPYSILYVLTGGGVGFFVGVEGDVLLLSLGSGAFWPATVKAIDAARRASAMAVERWNNRPSGSGPEPSGSK
jgi:hypothetical protein